MWDRISDFQQGDKIHFIKGDNKGYTNATVCIIRRNDLGVRQEGTEKIIFVDPRETKIFYGFDDKPKFGFRGGGKGEGISQALKEMNPSPWLDRGR